jgi:uncharacterized UBP type Zn finger protein
MSGSRFGDVMGRIAWITGATAVRCRHLDLVRQVTPSADGCEDCLAMGDTWVHLRMCLQCGKTGCCDQSKNRHARAHHRETGHPLVTSLEPGESWIWCYEDDALLRPPR